MRLAQTRIISQLISETLEKVDFWEVHFINNVSKLGSISGGKPMYSQGTRLKFFISLIQIRDLVVENSNGQKFISILYTRNSTNNDHFQEKLYPFELELEFSYQK